MKTIDILLKISILGMLITSFIIYIDQATYGQYIYNFEFYIWKTWYKSDADKGAFLYLIYVLGILICRLLIVLLYFIGTQKLVKYLILYLIIFIAFNSFGVIFFKFIFFDYFSFLPHIIFSFTTLILAVRNRNSVK